MEHDISNLRAGDIVIREADVAGGVERNVGEVLQVRARVRYLDVDYDWREWWDVDTGVCVPFLPEMEIPWRLRRASPEEIVRFRRG